MALVGTLLFCTVCGSILQRCPLDQDMIKCDMCATPNNSKIILCKQCLRLIRIDRWPASQKTTSAPEAFPSRLFDKQSNVQILTAEDRDTWATTPKACPKCDNAELRFRDVQTRGVDEGSTIFYKCPACGHGYVNA
jgi:DNA-directed RNA polymerase I subunit RPA12